METDNKNISVLKVGLFSSWALAILTLITFGLAMIAIPPSGPYCPTNCMSYPFPDILDYYPRDYFWMFAAIFQLCVYIIFMIANHFNSSSEKKIFSFISLSFAIIAGAVLLVNYFIQFTVVPVSVMQGQTEGIPLLTQYNGHGIFIALEELGFTMMSIAFFFQALALTGKSRLENVVRWILVSPLAVNIFAFTAYSLQFGLDRDYRYEVVALTINWLVSILIGILMSIKYRGELKIGPKNGPI